MAVLTVLPSEDPESAAVEITFDEGDVLLERMLRHGVALAHDCGGKLACVSCRIIVREGFGSLSEPSEDELDMLERAGVSEPGSRLACQATAGTADLAIEIPLSRAPPVSECAQHTMQEITLTASAARHLAAQLAKRPAAVGVRLSVLTAGCSGYRYRLDIAEQIDARDAVFESAGVRIVVDAASLSHVHGTTVDIRREGLSVRLRFDNPNSVQTCGCGESFGLKS
jgi:iron-sulfur cluster assembly protein